MPTEALTDNRVRSAPPPISGILELWDTRSSGLCLRVMASGFRSWTFRYRPKGAASLKRVTLGPYPTLSLSQARDQAGRLRVAVREGANPQGELRDRIVRARSAEENRALTFDQ